MGVGQAKLTTTSLNISGLGATDKVQFSFKFDGSSAQVYDVAVGADLDALIVNLNAASGFSTYAVASKSGSELVITGKTLGADKSIELTNVTYTDTLGASIELPTATNLPYSEKAKLTSAAFGGPITLDADDKIQFDIAVGGAASKLVTIDKATIDAALSSNTGTIGTSANYVTVLNKALTNAGVTGVAASIETVGLDAGRIVFTSTARGSTASIKISDAAATKGAMEISVDTIDISASTLAALGADSGDKIRQVISAYVSVVNTAIGKVTTAASNLGAVSKQIETQTNFVDTLVDTINKGVGDLIDADLSEESTRLQALQTKQQLGVQALSIANASTQNILRLFQ
ncbi:flagellin [Aureimonas sp. Leaf427]|nr:flagellin [Aureimonas sp. Leaf427]KQT66286.1 hypothetical protein ASG62_19890 [Aureimonas sp. Leaf427]